MNTKLLQSKDYSCVHQSDLFDPPAVFLDQHRCRPLNAPDPDKYNYDKWKIV